MCHLIGKHITITYNYLKLLKFELKRSNELRKISPIGVRINSKS